MSSIQLKRLSADSPDVQLMRKVNIESFPPEEYISEPDMFVFGDMDIRVLGIYEDDAFIGFFTVIAEEPCFYICYFAIDSAKRGSGCGTLALKALLEHFAGWQAVVDFEAFDEPGAPNPTERKRRRDFYLRNGFNSTGNYMYYMNSEFEVACSRNPMDERSYQRILDRIHANAEQFPGIMYKRVPSC